MKFIIALPIVAILAFVAGGELMSTTVVVEQQETLRLLPEEQLTSQIKVPAVDENGNGVVTEVKVVVEPGRGRTLASIQNILFFVDTQNSIRTARDVAQDVTGFDLSQHDLIYTITADAAVIEGPSAGAALTIATIAALERHELNPDVMITGTIRPDGGIGRVGRVPEKAEAAKDQGATLFLIPDIGGFPIHGFAYERHVTCQVIGGTEFCETSYVKQATEEGPDIDVKEVATVQDALPYFLGQGIEE